MRRLGIGKGELDALLPDREQTLLLRACTGDRAAWERWADLTGDPAAALSAGGGSTRSLAPMIERGLREAGADPGSRLRVTLRAAATRERERTATMWEGISHALGALAAAGLDVTVIGGVAVAQCAYPEPGLRHCHGLELLVGSADRPTAAAALRGLGGGEASRIDRAAEVVSHPLGAPIALQDRLLVMIGPELAIEPILARRRSLALAGHTAPTLSPDDLLLTVIAGGLCDRQPGSLQWALDAHQIISRESGLDWGRLAATAQEARLSRIAALGVGYVSEQLGPEIPAAARVALEDAADQRGEELALVAAVRRRRWEGGWRRMALRPASSVALVRWAPRYLAGRLRERRA